MASAAGTGLPGRRVFVVGVGMSKFVKPKKPGQTGPGYEQFVEVAVRRALEDACVGVNDIQQVAVGRLNETGGTAQRSLHRLGFHGIPFYNIANACASGSNAIFLGRQLIAGGIVDCMLAVGVEEMAAGSLALPTNRSLDDHVQVLNDQFGLQANTPELPQMFAGAAKEHMALHKSTPTQFALVAEKNHRHSANNPYSQFRDVYTLDQVMSSTSVSSPLTKLQCSPTSDGAAAVVICSEDFVRTHGLEGQAVEIIGQAMSTEVADSLATADERKCINMTGFPMARRAADTVYQQAGIGPHDIQVIELHDCFSSNEILTYESLRLCPEGRGGELVEAGQTTYGGKWVVNPSGGLISKGHPIGATGVAQCCELCWQLRGECGPRQVAGARVGLQHNLGLPGNVVVTAYRRPEQWQSGAPKRQASGAMGFPEGKVGSGLISKL